MQMLEIETAAQDLLILDEDELIAQIGVRLQAIEVDPRAASIDALKEEVPVPRGAFDDLLKAGMSIFTQVSTHAYELLCSTTGGDSDLVEELDKLMKERTAESAAKMTATLAPFLVSNLGLPPSMAVIVGSLIVKKIDKGTSDLIFENWKNSLPGRPTISPPPRQSPPSPSKKTSPPNPPSSPSS